MFAPIIWLWASINFAWILLASRKKIELCENEKQAAAVFVIAFLMKQIIKDRVCYHYRYHYRYRYRCPCDWKPFLKFGRNFRHTAGWFSYVFLRDGPGKGHCLYKQCNTPKQTRLRKALLHYFWQSPRHKGQQGSAIVSSLKTGFASRPIFSKVMLSSDQK